MNEPARVALRPDRTITDPMPLRDPGIRGALVPSTAAEAMEMAKMVSSGRFAIPAYLKDNPGDCLRLVLIAARSRLDTFMLANQSYLTKSRSGEERMEFQAQAIHAIVLASGILVGDLGVKVEGEGANLSCTVTAARLGGGTHTETYYMKTITTKNSPLWAQQPRQQLIYYAERAWCRAHAPDAIMGLIATEDPPLDVTPEVVTIEEPRGALAQVEAHLGVGDETEEPKLMGAPEVADSILGDETEPASGETEGGASPEGEAAAEQGRDTSHEDTTPAPEREVADSAGQPLGRGPSERLGNLKFAIGKLETDEEVVAWLLGAMVVKTTDLLEPDERVIWNEHVDNVREALGAMA